MDGESGEPTHEFDGEKQWIGWTLQSLADAHCWSTVQ